jgi:gas vesicle protein
VDFLNHLIDAPVANILIVAGVIFLGIAAVGRITGKIEPDKMGRIMSGVLGAVLLIAGSVSHVQHDTQGSGTQSTGEQPAQTLEDAKKQGNAPAKQQGKRKEELHGERQETLKEQGNRLDQLHGDWQGTIQEVNLPVVFHLRALGSGTADSPSQGSFGMTLNYTVNGNAITITIPSVSATYSATVDGSHMSGTFYQYGRSPSLALTKH